MPDRPPKSRRTVSASEMAAVLGITQKTLTNHRQQNGLPMASPGKYDVEEVCRWVMTRPKRGKMWECASRWLASNADGAKKPKPKTKKQPDPKPEEPPKPVEQELPKTEPPKGEQADAEASLLFSPILDKFRRAVDYLADSFNEAVQQGDYGTAAVIMKSWVPAFDNLRKAEESVLELGKARGALLPKEDVQAAFVALATNLKNRLMVLPGKLSHELVNQRSANKIMEVLDAEIRECLESVGRDPFGSG
jgi:hypothetical protein